MKVDHLTLMWELGVPVSEGNGLGTCFDGYKNASHMPQKPCFLRNRGGIMKIVKRNATKYS